MITLKLDLDSTHNYGMSIYKGDDSNFYMFNDCGDLVCRPKRTYGIKMKEVWEFAIGTFKINEDRIITQTQEYFEKYYVCDKAAYEDSLKNKASDENSDEDPMMGYYMTKAEYEKYLDDVNVVEAVDKSAEIEEEIQRVLEELKSTTIYSEKYHLHLSTLERLIAIREKI